jgi:Tfp pilus assembly protein PilF
MALAHTQMWTNPAKAKWHLNKALEIQPEYIPALLNLADLYRSEGQEIKANLYLEEALTGAPDSGIAQYSMALYQIRNKDYKAALKHLKLSTELEHAQSRYFYTYALALEKNNDIAQAIEVLKKAEQKWPNRFDILLLLVQYMERDGQTNASYAYLSKLSAISPNDPEVRKRVQALQK